MVYIAFVFNVEQTFVYFEKCLLLTRFLSLVQLEAIDQDISSKNGKICNYAILENGIPFSINSAGVVSLQEELPANYPDYVVFHVKATDCAKKDSDDDAVIKITVKERLIKTTPSTQLKRPDCKPGRVFNFKRDIVLI